MDIIDYMPQGKENAISQNELSNVVGMACIDLKRLIQDARLKGEPIASGVVGYWLTDEPEDLLRTANRLEQQALARLLTAQALKQTITRLKGEQGSDDILCKIKRLVQQATLNQERSFKNGRSN